MNLVAIRPGLWLLALLVGPALSRATGQAAGQGSDICALLPAAEVTQLTGIPIERTERTSNGCSWYPKPGAAQQKATASIGDAFQKLTTQEPGSLDDATRSLERIVKGVGSMASEGGALFTVSVERQDADQAEATFKTTMGMLSGMAGGVRGSGLEPVAGIGDRAYIGPAGAGLYIRKGGAWVEMDLRAFPGTREQAIAMARRLISRL